MFTYFVYLLLIQSTFQWSVKIHRLILELALRGLDDEVLQDLTKKSYLFDDIDQGGKPYNLAGLADSLRYGIDFHFFDTYHYSTVFMDSDDKKELEVNDKNHLITVLKSLTRHLTNPAKERSSFFDTLSLLFSTHFFAEIFQPFHTFEVSGLGMKIKHRENVHSYWDGGCDQFRHGENSKIADELQEAERLGYYTYNSQKLNLDLENKFDFYDTESIIKGLEDIYTKKVHQYKDGGNYSVHDLIIDDEFIKDRDSYKEFCLKVAVPNILHASHALRSFLRKAYANLDEKIKKDDFTYYKYPQPKKELDDMNNDMTELGLKGGNPGNGKCCF